MGSFPIYHRDDYWKIWYEILIDGEKFNGGLWWKSYKHKSSAVRAAKKQFDEPRVTPEGKIITFRWTVSQTNPFEED